MCIVFMLLEETDSNCLSQDENQNLLYTVCREYFISYTNEAFCQGNENFTISHDVVD